MNEEKWIKAINQIHMDETTKQRIYERCIEKKSRMKLRYYRPVILYASIVCMLVTVPIIGRMTSNVLDRMRRMDKKEIKTLNTMIQEQTDTVGADSFSRAFTEDEEGRKKVLLEEYTYKERFPKGEVSMMEEPLSQLADEVYYDMKNSKFYLPSRELTDEELLQIIDFNHKRDYSLQVMNKVEIPDVNMKDLNTMDLLEKSEYIIENIYGVDTKSLEHTIEWYNEDKDAYEITFTEGNREFYIRMEKEALKVTKVAVDLKKDLEAYQIITEELVGNETRLFERSKDIIENMLGIDQQIKSAWCNYYIGDGNRGQDRNLNYLFESEDGSAYIFNYVYEEGVYEDGILRSFEYIGSFEWYHKLLKDNEPKNAKRGIQRVEFEMDLEK